MAKANPYESPNKTSKDRGNSGLSVDQNELLANTRFCIRLVAVIAGLTALYFALRLFVISWFYVKYGDVGFDQGPRVQSIQIVWAVVSLFAYAGLCGLFWRYSKQITGVLSGNDRFSSIIPAQNRVWFASALWIMASAIVYFGLKLVAGFFG
jgi:hypothetical protein